MKHDNAPPAGVTPELVMAYADGELPAAEAARVEASMAADPAVARQVARYRAQRAALQEAFGGVLAEPVPPQLVATAMGVPRIRPPRRWRLREWAALAASVVLGVALAPVLRPSAPASLVAADERGLVAAGALATALDQQLAGDSAGRVRLGISFRAVDGGWCRSFAVEVSGAFAGLACRTAGGWRVPVLADLPDGAFKGNEYRLAAAATPPAVIAAIEARIAGEPADAAAERAARDRGWQE